MKDFVVLNYYWIGHVIEAIPALLGVFLFSKFRKPEKYFIFFLVCLAIFDALNLYRYFVKPDKILSFLIGTIIEKNYWWSALYWKIGAILFFSFYYLKILRYELFKLIIRYSSYTFLIFCIIYIAFNWNAFLNSYIPIIDIVGAIIIFLCSMFYFIEILQSDKILIFYRDINFYISAAIFIWWLIITPVVFYDVYMVSSKDKNYLQIRRMIYIFANIFMYSTFTFALAYCKPKYD